MTDYANLPHDAEALELAAKSAVAIAAFWASFADAAKVLAEAARTDAVRTCGGQRREKTTATNERGQKLGALSRSDGHAEWAASDRAAIFTYFEKTYPQWIDVTPAFVVPEHVEPEVRRLNPDKLADWLTTLTTDGVDPETGVDVADMVRWVVTEGRWTLTKDKAAKSRVLAAIKEMAEQSGIPIPAEARQMIEGGK